MARVTGIGGVFFKSEDPQALLEWYVEHLGLSTEHPGFVVMSWGDAGGTTIWSPFPADTDYFGSSGSQWMVNYRVDDLDELLAQLRDEGIRVDDETMGDENGKFGWCWDLEGNRIELWEPPPGR